MSWRVLIQWMLCGLFGLSAVFLFAWELNAQDDRGRVYGQDRFLKQGYFRLTIDIEDRRSEELKATLVTKKPRRPGPQAVLYLHGYLDYFFQHELGDAFVYENWSFYALDLRRHGRSWHEDQILSYSRNFTEFFEEIDRAIKIIKDEGHETIVFLGHSTGGLIAAHYIMERGEDSDIDLLVLNSPFLKFNFGEKDRSFSLFSAAAIGTVLPKVRLGPEPMTNYGKSIHKSHHGEWNFDTIFKPIQAPKARAGWIKATRRAQRKVNRGNIDIPILVLHSCNSVNSEEWTEDFLTGDGVLNVDHIRELGKDLGPDVDLLEIPKALHDVFLSARPVRREAFKLMFEWIKSHDNP
ncbi:MAG: alpha/beta hydrolase [Saprospirales bacterium]|nr:MAG: alpha/beta hydrolase [Saprospirales bacterium]